MVLIIHPKRYYSSRHITSNATGSLKNIDPIDTSTPPDTLEPDPIMSNIQKDTNVRDLGVTSMSGEGFKVYGAGHGNSNSKLRKFINLKL